MRVYVHSHGLTVSNEERAYIEDRIVSVLWRFGSNVHQVLVSIRDMNGPKGGYDKLGRAIVFLTSGRSLIVQATETRLHLLVSELANLVRAAVRSHVVRSRQRPIRLRRKHRPVTRAVRRENVAFA
jgi:hypothetical protein